MKLCPVLAQVLRLLAACVLSAALLLLPAAAADAVFPVGSRLGLVPPAGLKAATSFPGFEDQENGVFIRLVALPAEAFAEIEKTMTNDALKKQGMTVEKRESCRWEAATPSWRSCARKPPRGGSANGC